MEKLLTAYQNKSAGKQGLKVSGQKEKGSGATKERHSVERGWGIQSYEILGVLTYKRMREEKAAISAMKK